ncbi:carbohydrate kinase, thermoresistant glucokinase [Trypanosoma rangeli SC58]|uniref:Gluconokinase n=1 Tax=Trypanosoma rangeli SC58 TaxID=429131 RepID=A0A061J119_TRYRA|nr:carbohydrate kinase, thermoresistant glucokinase [Trypanosoma rangeli SC58]
MESALQQRKGGIGSEEVANMVPAPPLMHPSSVPVAVVVMGPSGTGKSTIGSRLAQEMGWHFAEGDDYHSADNVQKMATGVPLTDEDRLPWLSRLRTEVIEGVTAKTGCGVVLACSALRRVYRDLLRADNSGESARVIVFFVELVGDLRLVAQRIQGRRHAYMPASLLLSQYATLEPLQLEKGEHGMRVSVELGPAEIVRRVASELRQRLWLHL